METRSIYCCGCGHDVMARLTDGREIYSRQGPWDKNPFWVCDECGSYVGCHHKMQHNKTLPLGNLADAEMRNARKHIHQLIDPHWKSGRMPRGLIYAKMTEKLGRQYHTGEIRTIDEARRVYRYAREIVSGNK